jgi:hypothetical protein
VLFALSLQEGHAVLLPPIVFQWTARAIPQQNKKAKTTPSSREDYGWGPGTIGFFNAFDGSLLLPHCLDSILLPPPLPLYLVTGFEFGLIVVPARRKAQVNKFPFFI